MPVCTYIKKPIEISAIELTWGNWNAICDFVDKDYFCRGVSVLEDGTYTDDCVSNARIGLLIKTLEGTMLAAEGDFIIKGINGEFYPCKPDIFHKTYDIKTGN